jgi:hypothetical protein
MPGMLEQVCAEAAGDIKISSKVKKRIQVFWLVNLTKRMLPSYSKMKRCDCIAWHHIHGTLYVYFLILATLKK